MARIFKAHKKKDGTQMWGVDYRDPRNKRVKEIVGSQRKAKLRLAEVNGQIEDGSYARSARKGMTFSGLRALWFQHRSEKRSLSADRGRWVWIVEGLGADRRIDRVTSTDILEFRDWLRKQNRRPRKTKKKKPAPPRRLSPAGVNRVMQLLRAAYNLACRLPPSERPVRENPASHIKPLREAAKRDRICSRGELVRLLGRASPKLGLAILISYEIGAREGEIAKLTWDRFDLRAKTFRLVDVKDVGHRERNRTIAISARLANRLKTTPKRPGDPRIVGLRADNISSLFGRLAKRLRIIGLRFHDLRHSSATNLRRAGVDLETIKAMLGHATWEAMSIYQTVTPEDMHAALKQRDDRSLH